MSLDRYDLILSMAWLDSYCPSVDYRAKTVTFEHDGKAITLKPPPADTDVHTIAHTTESNNADADTTMTVQHADDDEVPPADQITSIVYDRKLSLQVYTVNDIVTPQPTPMQQVLKNIPADFDKQSVVQLTKLINRYMDVFPVDLPDGVPT